MKKIFKNHYCPTKTHFYFKQSVYQSIIMLKTYFKKVTPLKREPIALRRDFYFCFLYVCCTTACHFRLPKTSLNER